MRDRHLRQPALRGPGGDHRRDPGGHRRAAPASSATSTAARRSRAPSRSPSRATCRDRRQGPRAGPGVRGRAQGAVRRRDGRARGAARRCCAAHEALERPRGSRRRPARSSLRRAPTAARRGPTRVVIDSREVGPGRPVRRPPGRARRRRRVRGRRRWRPAPGACSSTRGTWAAAARRGDAARCSPPTTRSPRCGALARAWRRELGAHVIARHRLDRQDLDQGPARRAARAAPARSRRTAQNFNTEIGLPLAILAAPRRHRGAGARDGACAAFGPDRRAGRDRRARRRRDHRTSARSTSSCWARSRASRRPRPSCSWACATARRPSCPPASRCWSRSCATALERRHASAPGGDVRSRRALRADGPTRAIDVPPGERIELELPFTQAHNLLQHARRGGRGARRRRAPGGPRGRALLGAARRARRARRAA